MNYLKGMIIKIDKDWTADYTFDFTDEVSKSDELTSYTVTTAVGLTVLNSQIVGKTKVVVRLSAAGLANTKYSFSISATSTNGEVFKMNVVFLAI